MFCAPQAFCLHSKAFASERNATVNSKKEVLDTQSAEMKDLRKLPDAWETYKRLKPIADNLRSIKFTKAKEKYKAEHKAEIMAYADHDCNCSGAFHRVSGGYCTPAQHRRSVLDDQQ